MQLMGVVIPRLEDLQKNQGEQGRKQIQQYTRYLTVILALFQSFMLARLLSSIQGPPVVLNPGLPFLVNTTIVLTASAMFILWIGELITANGVGNGASLLIFLGIASRLPVIDPQHLRIRSNRSITAMGRRRFDTNLPRTGRLNCGVATRRA